MGGSSGVVCLEVSWDGGGGFVAEEDGFGIEVEVEVGFEVVEGRAVSVVD